LKSGILSFIMKQGELEEAHCKYYNSKGFHIKTLKKLSPQLFFFETEKFPLLKVS